RVTSHDFEILNSIGEKFDVALGTIPFRSRRSILGTLKLMLIALELRLPEKKRNIVIDLSRAVDQTQFFEPKSDGTGRSEFARDVINNFETLADSPVTWELVHYNKIIHKIISL